LCPAMIHGGLGVPRHDAWRGTPFHAGLQRATWDLYPATMHGEVQCICPAMHGGGAKRVRFKKKIQMRVKFKICFKFGLKIKKILDILRTSSFLCLHAFRTS
jgi:hypothetical protein